VRPGNNFVPNFQLFAKVEVNGQNEHPLYTYLKKHCPPTTDTFYKDRLMYYPIKSSDVAWNWETFLVDQNGRVVQRAPPPLEPMMWESAVTSQMALTANAGAVVGK